jgi:hypothetical protein
MSRGDVVTRPFTEVENTPRDGHAAAISSAVTTTRVPSGKRSTRSTRTPGSPNNNVVPSGHKPSVHFLRPIASQLSDFGRPRASSCNDTPNESEITAARLKLKSRHTSISWARWKARAANAPALAEMTGVDHQVALGRLYGPTVEDR